jgi:hypothetical protein
VPLHRPPERLLDTNRVRDGFDISMFEIYTARAGGVAAAEDLAKQTKSRPA